MILDISKRLNDKKEMNKLQEDYEEGIVMIEGDKFETLFGKVVYPVAMVANAHLTAGQSTFKLSCGGFVNLTDEEWHGEWKDRLMKRPDNYEEPRLSDLKGVPAGALHMFTEEE